MGFLPLKICNNKKIRNEPTGPFRILVRVTGLEPVLKTVKSGSESGAFFIRVAFRVAFKIFTVIF